MKALIDTCVIIDYLQSREPFFDDGLNLAIGAANREYEAYITASSMTDIYYLIHRNTHNDTSTRVIINNLTVLFGLTDTYAEDCINAIHSNMTDYEDAVMIETAVRTGMDCIVTRNTKDYQNSSIPAKTPSEFLMLMEGKVKKNK